MGVGGVSLWQVVIIFLVLVLIGFVLWLETRIIRKAGYSGWWVLVTLVPLLNIVMIYVFAFSRWPNEMSTMSLGEGERTSQHNSPSLSDERPVTRQRETRADARPSQAVRSKEPESGSEEAGMDEDRLYEKAWGEFEEGIVDRGVWARCFSESDGDENRAKAMYLAERVNVLKEKELQQLKHEAERRKKSEVEGALEDYQAIIRSTLGKCPNLTALPDVNKYGKWGETRLMKAAREGSREEVVKLLALGADPTLKERYTGDSAKRIAEQKEDMEIAHILELAEKLWGQVETRLTKAIEPDA